MFSSLQMFLYFKSIMDTTKEWQFGKTLPDRINYMLQNQLMCDVTFHVGANRTPIKAHKFMLASASPVFYSIKKKSWTQVPVAFTRQQNYERFHQ
jgi:hypothetical protein